MDTIDRLLGEADQAWRGYGVGSADRATLAADLRLDLRAAAADGAIPRSCSAVTWPASRGGSPTRLASAGCAKTTVASSTPH